MDPAPWGDTGGFLLRHTRMLLDCHARWTGRELLPRTGSAEADARNLWDAPFVVVSGNAAAEQILNYGNARALALWEMDWNTLTRTPSRQTAEPVHQAERAVFLERVRRHGCIEDYAGIRISSSGRRFRIDAACVWNLVDEVGIYQGQAAAFSRWTMLDP